MYFLFLNSKSTYCTINLLGFAFLRVLRTYRFVYPQPESEHKVVLPPTQTHTCFSTPTPDKHLSVLYPCNFAFSRMSHRQGYRGCNLKTGFFHSGQHLLRFIRVGFVWVYHRFYFSLSIKGYLDHFQIG